MIRKPEGDWHREAPVVEAARTFGGAASRTVSAGVSGVVAVRNAVRGVVCGVMALVFGWAALGAGLLGRNIPLGVFIGCCSLGLGWLAVRSVRGAFGGGRAGQAGPGSMLDVSMGGRRDGRAVGEAGAYRGGMVATDIGSFISYDRKKVFLDAAKQVVLFGVLAAALLIARYRSPVVGVVLVLALGAIVCRFVLLVRRGLDGDLTALSWDERQVRVRTLTSSRAVRWEMVEAVDMRRTVRRLWGLIPVSTKYALVFGFRVGRGRKRVLLPVSLLNVSPGSLEALGRMRAGREVRAMEPEVGGAARPAFGRKQVVGVEPGVEPRAEPGVNAGDRELVGASGGDGGGRGFGGYERGAVSVRAFGRKGT